jgi:hypothetical protein
VLARPSWSLAAAAAPTPSEAPANKHDKVNRKSIPRGEVSKAAGVKNLIVCVVPVVLEMHIHTLLRHTHISVRKNT